MSDNPLNLLKEELENDDVSNSYININNSFISFYFFRFK